MRVHRRPRTRGAPPPRSPGFARKEALKAEAAVDLTLGPALQHDGTAAPAWPAETRLSRKDHLDVHSAQELPPSLGASAVHTLGTCPSRMGQVPTYEAQLPMTVEGVPHLCPAVGASTSAASCHPAGRAPGRGSVCHCEAVSVAGVWTPAELPQNICSPRIHTPSCPRWKVYTLSQKGLLCLTLDPALGL